MSIPSPTDRPDSDPAETHEWLDALASLVATSGPARALHVLDALQSAAHEAGIVPHVQPFSAYRNTIALERQGPYPGDLRVEERLTANALQAAPTALGQR